MGRKVSALLLALISALIFCETVFGMGSTPNSIAKTNAPVVTDNAFKFWHISAGMGYTNYRNTSSNDGSIATGRFALGFDPIHLQKTTLGLETGIQSGNTMKIDVSQDILHKMGGTAISSTVRPMVDLLATVHLSLNKADTVFLVLKGGAAYRQLQFDRDTIPNKAQISPELQVGLGFKISSSAKLIAYYQGIYGGDMGFETHEIDAYSSSGSVQNIPTQYGGFLSIEMAL